LKFSVTTRSQIDFYRQIISFNPASNWSRILGVMPFPPAAVKQKAKKGVCVDGRGIVLPFSKTQPVFCFLCAVGLRQLPCGKK